MTAPGHIQMTGKFQGVQSDSVNNHRQNILQKMNTDNVVEAINYARKLGLLD